MVINRHVTITHKNATRRIKTKRGCPQGGVLSPFLWNLVIDDLLQYTAKHIPGYIQAFADIISLAEVNDLDVIWQRTQTTIKTIENWCQSKGLNISALKTKIVMFTWYRKWSLRPIEVCGETIELSNEVKLLGITLDSKLTFNTHIDNMHWHSLPMQKSQRPHMGPLNKGMPLDIHSNYQTHSSLLFYRVDQSCGEQNHTKRLERVQGMALKYMTGAMPSTPYTALNYLTGTPHITDYLKGEAAKGAVRLMGQGDWTLETAPSGKGIIKAHINKHDSWDITKPKLVLDHSYTITYPTASLTEDYKN